jgi:hypothetical protein
MRFENRRNFQTDDDDFLGRRLKRRSPFGLVRAANRSPINLLITGRAYNDQVSQVIVREHTPEMEMMHLQVTRSFALLTFPIVPL